MKVLLWLLLSAAVWAGPEFEGTWRLDARASSGLYGPFGQIDQTIVLTQERADRVVVSMKSGGWSARDAYWLDGKPSEVDMIAPNGSRLSGTRTVRWNKDKTALLVAEDLAVATPFGNAKIRRDCTIRLQNGKLVMDSVEDSPLGHHEVHRVYRRL